MELVKRMAVFLDTKRNGQVSERESKLAAAEPRGKPKGF
jgi:hypothetical protein